MPVASGPLTRRRASFFFAVDVLCFEEDGAPTTFGGTSLDTFLAPDSDPVTHCPDDEELLLLL